MDTDKARVIRPGDPDHPGEQVKAAGNPAEPGALMALMGTITLRTPDQGDGVGIGITVSAVEDTIIWALGELGYTVRVNLTRTDR